MALNKKCCQEASCFCFHFKFNMFVLIENAAEVLIVFNSLNEMHLVFSNAVFTPTPTLFSIHTCLCITDHSNLRMRGFGVISTIPSWGWKKKIPADVRACDFGTLHPLGQMHPQQVDNPALAHLSADNNLRSLR